MKVISETECKDGTEGQTDVKVKIVMQIALTCGLSGSWSNLHSFFCDVIVKQINQILGIQKSFFTKGSIIYLLIKFAS